MELWHPWFGLWQSRVIKVTLPEYPRLKPGTWGERTEAKRLYSVLGGGVISVPPSLPLDLLAQSCSLPANCYRWRCEWPLMGWKDVYTVNDCLASQMQDRLFRHSVMSRWELKPLQTWLSPQRQGKIACPHAYPMLKGCGGSFTALVLTCQTGGSHLGGYCLPLASWPFLMSTSAPLLSRKSCCAINIRENLSTKHFWFRVHHSPQLYSNGSVCCYLRDKIPEIRQ